MLICIYMSLRRLLCVKHVRACVRACVCACVRACVRACVWVGGWGDVYVSPVRVSGMCASDVLYVSLRRVCVCPCDVRAAIRMHV